MLIDGIDVFVRVVRAGGLDAAARQSGIPAATLGARIAELEALLGTTLILPSSQSLHLTDAGERYFAGCVEALELLRHGAGQPTPGAKESPGSDQAG